MALLPRAANTEENNEGLGDRSVIPAGEYAVHVVASEMKPTKAKNGHYLSLQWKVIVGPYKGRVLFTNLNLDNPSKVAEEIAGKELNSICQAIGKVGVEDSVELHNEPCVALVAIEKKENSDYPPQNKIVGYKHISEFAGEDSEDESQPEEKQAEKPAAKPAAGKKKLPWEKN